MMLLLALAGLFVGCWIAVEIRSLASSQLRSQEASLKHAAALSRAAEAQEYVGKKIEEYIEHQFYRVH